MPWGNECIGEGAARVCYKTWQAPSEIPSARAGAPAQQVERYETIRIRAPHHFFSEDRKRPRFRFPDNQYMELLEHRQPGRSWGWDRGIPAAESKTYRAPVFGAATDPFHLFNLPGRIAEMRPSYGRYTPVTQMSQQQLESQMAHVANIWGLVKPEHLAQLREEGKALEIEGQVAQDIYDALRNQTGPSERRQMARRGWYMSDYRKALQIATEHYIKTGEFERRKGAEKEHIELQRREDEARFAEDQKKAQEELDAIRKERQRLEEAVELAEEEREKAAAEFAAYQATEQRLARLGLRPPGEIVGIAPGVSRPRARARKELGAQEGLGAYNALRIESRSYLGG